MTGARERDIGPDDASRPRRAVLVALVVAVVAAVASTIGGFLATRDTAGRVDTAPVPHSATPSTAPAATPSALEALGRRSPWNGYAATREWLVVYFGGDMDHLDEEPEFAAAPLEGGHDVTIELALDGEHFSPNHLVADDEQALVVGRRCPASPGATPTHAERFCDGGEPAAFRVDPASGTVGEVDVTPELRALPGLLVSSSQRTTDGWWLFGAVRGGAGEPNETVLIRATPARMEVAARWTGEGHACVAGDVAYALVHPEGPVVQRVPIGGDPAAAVELPVPETERPGSFGQLACAPDGPLLSGIVLAPGSSTGAGSEPAVLEWRDCAWRERDDLVPPEATTPAGEGVSDHGGAVLTWSDGDRHGVITVLPVDGEPRFEQADGGDVWHGSSGTRLGLIHHENDPGVATSTLPPGRFPGFDHLRLWD